MLHNIKIGFFARFFASHHHDGGRMCGCCQMLRLDRKLQWRHPAPAKWDEVRNYTHKTKLHEDAKKMIFFNQGNIFFYLECRHFKYQIFSTKPCGSQEIYWKYPILFDHAKRVFLVLPTTFNLVQRITVIVFFSIRGDCEEHNLAELFLSIEYWKQVILRSNSKRFSSFSLCLPV